MPNVILRLSNHTNRKIDLSRHVELESELERRNVGKYTYSRPSTCAAP